MPKWLTIRIDNDDAISKDYILDIEKNVKSIDCDLAISAPWGINYYTHHNEIRSRYNINNHFFAILANSNSKIKHVYSINHINLDKLMQVKIIGSKKFPYWCEVIHNSNFANGEHDRDDVSICCNLFGIQLTSELIWLK